LVEWGERFPELWPAQHTEIRIAHLSGEDRRIEVFTP
jgi:tRNA A37 threonylcarbamoyladenosine biosynthesis protein TsaE